MTYLENLFPNESVFTYSSILGFNGLVVLEAETSDPGASQAELITGNFGAGSAYKFTGRSRFRWYNLTNIEETGTYDVVISGTFNKAKISVFSGNSSISTEITGNGIFYLGEIFADPIVRVTIDGEGIFDQLILKPARYGLSFADNGEKTLYYSKNEGLVLSDSAIFTLRDNKMGTLEYNVNLNRIGKFVLLDIKNVFNNKGIGNPLNPGNFDNLGGVVGAYYSDEFFKERILVNDIPFEITIGNQDNIRCGMQKLIFAEPVKITKIHILASANHGDYNDFIYINDVPIQITVKDWCNTPKDLEFEYRYISTNQRQYIRCGLDAIAIQFSGFIESIILPNQPNIHIFAITFEPEF